MSSATRPLPAGPSELRAVLDALARIEGRLDRLEGLAEGALSDGRHAVAIATDAVDRRLSAAQERGVDVDARAERLIRLLEKATEPAALDALERAVALAPELPKALATATDGVDHAISRMQAAGIDVDGRLANLVRAAERLSSDEAIATLEATFGRIAQIRTVLESGVLDPAAVAIVSKAGRALAEAAAEPAAGVGAFGLVRAIGEDEVRAATGLLVRFARRMGAALRVSERAPRLGASKTQDTQREGTE